MVIEVEFGSRGAAGQIRNDPQYKPFLTSSDDGRQTTLKLKENTPESALDYITGEAAESKRQEADKAGQADLTRREREQIDFTEQGVNVPKVRSIKGIAQNVGVSDYMQFADLSLTVDENRSILQQAAKEERGSRDLGRDMEGEAMLDKRLSEAHVERKRGEVDRAKDFALVETDSEAQEFVESRGEFDIGFNRQNNRLIGQGEDFERLERRHENRSERAQTADEMRNAEVTRDPVQWTNNPAKYDFPGIDTVQPQQLHEQRSERAQRQDENELAPPADTKEQWAMNPDRYDWPGVDTPSGLGIGPGEKPPSEDEIPSDFGSSQDRPEPRPTPSIERNTEAPVTETAALGSADISLAPNEAFEGVDSGSQSSGRQGFGLAGDVDADMAFTDAEQQRSQSNNEIDEVFDKMGL